MNRRQIYYTGNFSPFVVIALGVLALAAFFITLPIFLAALVVFTAIGLFYVWKFQRAVKKAEEELRRQQEMGVSEFREEEIQVGPDGRRVVVRKKHLVIDVTPEAIDEAGDHSRGGSAGSP